MENGHDMDTTSAFPTPLLDTGIGERKPVSIARKIGKRAASVTLFEEVAMTHSFQTPKVTCTNGSTAETTSKSGTYKNCASPIIAGCATISIQTIPVESVETEAKQFVARNVSAISSGLGSTPSGSLIVCSPAKHTSRKHSSIDRLQRSRERNRMHARKTRQRKKEHSQVLQGRADELKQEQIRLRQIINEKHTASILVGLFALAHTKPNMLDDPTVEELLRRPVDEIPDSTKIPELPALILPGHHNTKRVRGSASCPETTKIMQPQHALRQVVDQDAPLDNSIDYDLLGKDRSTCTPQELDQIRRERNRMHAKRTRDRKRMFMEEMEELIKKLEDENRLLENHLSIMDTETNSDNSVAAIVSPNMAPSFSAPPVSPSFLDDRHRMDPPQVVSQINSLLAAAGAFERLLDGESTMDLLSSAATAVSASADVSGSSCCSDIESESSRPNKQRRMGFTHSVVPSSITTNSSKPVEW